MDSSAGSPRACRCEGIASVASFFVSRIDAQADAVLAPDSPLRGQVAIANAQHAYARYLARFAGARWEALLSAGAARSGRYGRAPGPRIPATPTSSTWSG